MSRVTHAQMKKLLDLLAENANGALINGKLIYHTNKHTFWKKIALQLNAIEGGAHKNTWKWCKMWADWKNKAQKKANIVLRRKSYNFEHPSPKLTNLELRLLRLVEYPIDDKADMIQLQMMNKNVTSDIHVGEETDMTAEYLLDDCNGQSNKEKMLSEDDDNNDELFHETKDDIFNESCKLFEELESENSTDTEVKKNKGHKIKKKRKITTEEHKTKASVMLQKEMALQKREELRLRAIELKLKGEELRLKEIEMNKVNYLTNLEEEKLKCFREISASLKEFLDRTRCGNMRCNNVI